LRPQAPLLSAETTLAQCPWNSAAAGGQVSDMSSGAGDDESDADLIIRSLIEPRIFATLFDRHAASVHRFLAARSNSGDAEDLVSETFVNAFTSREHFDVSYSRALPWLIGIANNVLRHHRRSESRRHARIRLLRPPEDPADPTEQVVERLDDEARRSRFVFALSSLTDEQRETFILVGDLGLSYEDAARALDIPIGTVRSRMNRARTRLRELLDIDGQYRETTPQMATEGLTE
jgi:RNA polymerase sigma factor (sigma-70 family)